MDVYPLPKLGNSPVSKIPIEGSTTDPFFPPVCLKYHWDPTAVLRHVVPQGPAMSLPLDPRPWTKVCLNYVNSGHAEEQAPTPPPDVVFPSGGEFYPPTRYSSNINAESALRRLDRPLGTCDKDQYEPDLYGDMYISKMLVPDRKTNPSSAMIDELSMPRALIRVGPYDCHRDAQAEAWDLSPLKFYNATKQQKYNQPFPTKK